MVSMCQFLCAWRCKEYLQRKTCLPTCGRQACQSKEILRIDDDVAQAEKFPLPRKKMFISDSKFSATATLTGIAG
jgi:hypothetical protein